MNSLEQRALVPVQYVGKKATKIDNVAGTGLIWGPGQIHYVPPLIAQRLARYQDVWSIVDDDIIDQDPAQVGLVVTPSDIEEEATDPSQVELQAKTLDLPNLHGMTRADIATFAAAQFNHAFPASLKKEDMINQIVNLANSRAAGAVE
ncbi:hypothetical protein ACMHYO_16220 [Allopusillimonas ginsengisoli]|uniref:hypothetical protein n=1 Tax=Allopusillimonas ginsengisoli TaxID=453575 RepID=UPI0039C20105